MTMLGNYQNLNDYIFLISIEFASTCGIRLSPILHILIMLINTKIGTLARLLFTNNCTSSQSS